MASSLRIGARWTSFFFYDFQSKSNLSCLLSPLSRNTGQWNLSKIGARYFTKSLSPHYAYQFKPILNLPSSFTRNFQYSAKKIFRRYFLGLGVTAAIIYRPSNIAHAMSDYGGGLVENSGYLKEDFHMVWALTRKYQLPLVMLMMLILGWRRPVTTFINALIFLFCTRPNPFSIYLFIEHLRKMEMQREPKLRNTKLLYASKIDVEDYKLVCYGEVELWDKKMHLIGLLGGWWVVRVSQIG